MQWVYPSLKMKNQHLLLVFWPTSILNPLTIPSNQCHSPMRKEGSMFFILNFIPVRIVRKNGHLPFKKCKWPGNMYIPNMISVIVSLDEDIEKFYTSEKNISKLLSWATGLCIFISCLGLLGLVMHSTQPSDKGNWSKKGFGCQHTTDHNITVDRLH